MHALRVTGLLCLGGLSLMNACDDEPAGPPPPLSIRKAPTNSGDQQTDTVFATLAPFRVLVQRGTTPAPGVSVSWTPADSGAPPSQTTTDASGIASLTLPRFEKVGTHTVRASVTEAVGSPVTFIATATAGHPILNIVSGNNQVDTTKARLGADYVVQLTDSHGNAFPGVVIDWAVTAGGGSITPARSTTDASGHASARHTLGADPGPQTVTATASGLPATPQVGFTAITLGTLLVSTTTTGTDLDANGYTVRLHSTARDTTLRVGANTTVTARVFPAEYQVTLGDVVLNCDTTSAGSSRVTVPSGGSTTVAFAVACARASLLTFVNDPDGWLNIYTIQSNDPGNPRASLSRLTTGPWYESGPVWSPDGSKIGFARCREYTLTACDIYVMNSDGSMITPLTTDGLAYRPAWSPGGGRIAFTHCHDAGLSSCDLYVMNADGSTVTPLTTDGLTNASAPAWSPDGGRIAFTRSGNIYAMNTDGSTVTPLTTDGGDGPAWSPDGGKIAFSRGTACGKGLFLMNADGSGVKLLVDATCSSQYAEAMSDPSWSPDGSRIAFTDGACDTVGYGGCGGLIRIVSADGTALGVLTGGVQPNWRR